MSIVALRRDHVPGATGLAGAIVGPLLVVGVVTILAWIAFRDSTMTEIVLLFGINAIMVVGFQVFVGNTGIVSFGHVAFMALGAYGAGIAAVPLVDKGLFLPDLPGFIASVELSIVPALIVGGAVAAVFALASGTALMRLSGAAASIATLGLLVIVNNVLAQATPITRGPQSLFGVPSDTTFFWVFFMLAAVVVISGWFKWSSAGLRARATRDDPIAAESAGISVLRARLWPFVLSAFITGIGGGLFAMLLTAFSPASFFIPQLVVVLTMAIIGGISSITGALTGAAVVTLLTEVLRRLEGGFTIASVDIDPRSGASAAVLGIALILMLRWRPEGLLGAAEVQVEPPRRGGDPTPQPAGRAPGSQAPEPPTASGSKPSAVPEPAAQDPGTGPAFPSSTTTPIVDRRTGGKE